MQDIDEQAFSSRKRIFGATSLVVIVIFLSKVTGLVRDQIMTGYFGISYDTDAFTWAFFIPNLFKILFAESLIIAAFIPIYSSYLKKDDKIEMRTFVNSVANLMILVFIALSAIIFIFSPQIGSLLSNIANNQMDVVKFVTMNRIMIFSLVTLGLSGLVTGILNSHDVFVLPSAAPAILNIAIIISVIVLYRRLDITSMAVGAMVGSVAHLLIQLPKLRVAPLKYRPIIDFKNKGVREIFALMFPILLSLGAVQLNNGVDKFFALNLGAGNTTALDISWRLANLPLGVFSVAVITVLYPLISRQAASGDEQGIKRSFSLGIREIGYIMIPAATGLIILGYPIIKLLFERSSFLPADTLRVSEILIYHSLGLVFFGMLMVLNRVFYAFKNVYTPLKVAAASIAFNLLFDWVLIRFMDVNGLALSTSLVALANVAILMVILKKKLGSLGGKRITVSYLKILGATAVMGVSVYFIWRAFDTYAYRGTLQLIIFLVLAILIAAGIYIICTYLLRMDEIKFVARIIRSLKGRDDRKKD